MKPPHAPDGPKKPALPGQDSREARLAQALRANLRRRKAAAAPEDQAKRDGLVLLQAQDEAD